MSMIDEVPHAQSRFKQQMLPACKPLYTPCNSAIIFLIIALISIVFGVLIFTSDDGVYEAKVRYDDVCEHEDNCTINISISKDLNQTQLFVYFQVSKLYQNNFLYGSSKNWDQFKGKYVAAKSLSKCEPLKEDENGTVYSPCGTLPMTVFNDTFEFGNEFPVITSKGISVSSFYDQFSITNQKYDDESAWLRNSELFPNGQKDERFINWVQIAPLSTFRKLWGKTEKGITLKKGEYQVNISNQYPVSSFGGKKYIIISEVGWTGGKNPFLGIFYFVLGGLNGIIGLIILILYYVGCFPIYNYLESNNIDQN